MSNGKVSAIIADNVLLDPETFRTFRKLNLEVRLLYEAQQDGCCFSGKSCQEQEKELIESLAKEAKDQITDFVTKFSPFKRQCFQK